MSTNDPPLTMCSPTMTTTKVCRLCGTKDVPFLNIFGTNMGLAAKIEELLFIEVKEWDDLPHNICFRCSTKVSEFHEFLENCLKTQKQFSLLLGKPYNFKRDKNTNARKTWEAKLNKSKLSNDAYCDELVKKALESVATLKLPSLKDVVPPKPSKSNSTFNGMLKHPSCKKNIKIVLKRVDSPNFPGIKMINNGRYIVTDKLNQDESTPSSEDVNSSKFSDLLQYKCHKCNEVIADRMKATGHVCKIAQTKETPVNTVTPITRSKMIVKKSGADCNISSSEIINLDDYDCPETGINTRKSVNLSANKGTIQGKNSMLLNMLLPEMSRDSTKKGNATNNQILPVSLPPNYCLVPMGDNMFTIQSMSPQLQNTTDIPGSRVGNFQNRILSGAHIYQNNSTYLPSEHLLSQNVINIGQSRNSDFEPPPAHNFPTDLRSAIEMSQKYLCSLNPASEQTVVPETTCTERKRTSKVSEAKKSKTSVDNSGPYPVSLLYRSTQDEHDIADAVKDHPNLKNSDSNAHENSEKSLPSSSSKLNEMRSKPPKKRGHKRSDSIPPQNIKEISQNVTSEGAKAQPLIADGSFFTVVNVEPFFKPGNVPPMKICLKKSAPQVQVSNTPTYEFPKRSKMISENVSKKNDNTLYKCSICDLEFTREKRLLSHYKTHYEGFDDED